MRVNALLIVGAAILNLAARQAIATAIANSNKATELAYKVLVVLVNLLAASAAVVEYDVI
jgi:hypothetical protein